MAIMTAVTTGIATIRMAARAGIMMAATPPSGFSHQAFRSPEIRGKPPDSGGFFAFFHPFRWPGKPRPIAGHRGVALLNDALLRRLPGLSSGRIAQLVEQMTLNHRVPGSSPGAPTIQSSRTAETVADQKQAVSAGILPPIFNVPGLCRQ